MRRILTGVLLSAAIAVQFACEDQPCNRYVDYMCTCHAEDPDVDCFELENALLGAGPDVQDQCSIDLADQQRADDAAGLVCDVDAGF